MNRICLVFRLTRPWTLFSAPLVVAVALATLTSACGADDSDEARSSPSNGVGDASISEGVDSSGTGTGESAPNVPASTRPCGSSTVNYYGNYTSTYEYDAAGRLVEEVRRYPNPLDGVRIQYFYDEVGNLILEEWDEGFDGVDDRIEYLYRDRLLVEKRFGGSCVNRYSYILDAEGRVIERENCTCDDPGFDHCFTTFFDYEDGRLVRESDDESERLYFYDDQGRLIREESGGSLVEYSYTDEGILVSRIVTNSEGREVNGVRYSFSCPES